MLAGILAQPHVSRAPGVDEWQWQPCAELDPRADETSRFDGFVEAHERLRNAQLGGDGFLDLCFVAVGVRKSQRERARDWIAMLLRHVCCDRRNADRVEASTQEDACGPKAQLASNGALEQTVELVQRVVVDPRLGSRELPVGLDLEAASSPDQDVRDRNPPDRREVGFPGVGPAMAEVIDQGRAIELAGDRGMREKSL